MTMTNTPVEQRLSELTQRRSERLDVDDLPSTLTARESAAYVAETMALERQIHSIHAAVEATVFPSLDDDSRWLAHLHEWRDHLTATLEALPRLRNAEDLEQRQAINWCLGLIDRGMGVAPFSMPIVDLSSTHL